MRPVPLGGAMDTVIGMDPMTLQVEYGITLRPGIWSSFIDVRSVHFQCETTFQRVGVTGHDPILSLAGFDGTS